MLPITGGRENVGPVRNAAGALLASSSPLQLTSYETWFAFDQSGLRLLAVSDTKVPLA